MRCNLCETVEKTWTGSERSCAFDGEFSNNWNCATVSNIRKIIYDVVNEGRQIKGFLWGLYEDQTVAVIPTGDAELSYDPDDFQYDWLWVTYYKNRGSTDKMFLMADDHDPRVPTEEDLLVIADYYNE